MRLYFLSFILLFANSSKAQYYNGRVRIDSADRSYIFQITDNSRYTSKFQYYYWFKSGRIHQTQGSYYGKLLHGNYKVVDTDRHLLEEGHFKKGKKTGLWRNWYENGNLKSTWRRKFWFLGPQYNVRQYDIEGNVTKRGVERNGLFTGYQIEGPVDSVRVVQYKKGVVVPSKIVNSAQK